MNWEAAHDVETPAEAYDRGYRAGWNAGWNTGQEDAEPAAEAAPRGVTEAHRRLWVLPGAPVEVVKAVYRALASRAHPDVGGSHEGMVALNAAYEALLGKGPTGSYAHRRPRPAPRCARWRCDR